MIFFLLHYHHHYDHQLSLSASAGFCVANLLAIDVERRQTLARDAIPFFRPLFPGLEDLARFGRVLAAAGLLSARDFSLSVCLLGALAGVAIVFEGLPNLDQGAISLTPFCEWRGCARGRITSHSSPKLTSASRARS